MQGAPTNKENKRQGSGADRTNRQTIDNRKVFEPSAQQSAIEYGVYQQIRT